MLGDTPFYGESNPPGERHFLSLVFLERIPQNTQNLCYMPELILSKVTDYF